jgi:hypothetical protein
MWKCSNLQERSDGYRGEQIRTAKITERCRRLQRRARLAG